LKSIISKARSPLDFSYNHSEFIIIQYNFNNELVI